MGPRPFKPAVEFQAAVERGDLGLAVAIAKDLSREHDHPIPLERALMLLPLVAVQQPEAYDAWALRWLGRWTAETPGATIDAAIDVAAGLAALPVEPEAIDVIRRSGQS
jgi:hypothetical protein